MNDFTTILLQHTSIRKFTQKSVPKALLEEIVHAGQAASTSSHIQAVSIVRVSDTAHRGTLARLCGEQPYVATAAEFLVCCADLFRISQLVDREDDASDFDSMEHCITATVDTALFAQNMVIAAEANNLGCCYIGGIRNHPNQVAELLRLPRLVFPVFGLCIGYPAHQPERKPRLPQDVILYQDEYSFGEKQREQIAAYDDQVREYYIRRTNGKLDARWTKQVRAYAGDKQRMHLAEFLKSKGFAAR